MRRGCKGREREGGRGFPFWCVMGVEVVMEGKARVKRVDDTEEERGEEEVVRGKELLGKTGYGKEERGNEAKKIIGT